MALPPESPESPRGDGLVVTVNGVELPDVFEVSGLLRSDVSGPDPIELKQQTDDGKYVVRQLKGRAKTGQFTVTRGIDRAVPIDDWFREALGRDVASHPFEVVVVTRDQAGTPRETFAYGKCHVRSIETDVTASTESVAFAYEEGVPG